MDQPHVTVGMPVFNDPDGLIRSVPTVFGQTWAGPLRLLVIDDGSTDDTPQVLDSLAEVYDGIEVVRNSRNRGRPCARNQIIEKAGDGYLTWIDAGDLWHPRKLELQFAALLGAEEEDPLTPVICTGPLRWVFTDREQIRIRAPNVDGDQLYNALTGNLFPYLAAMIGRAEHFRSISFDERLLRRQDYDLLVRFLGVGGRVVATAPDSPLFTYFKSDVGSSPDKIIAANRVLRHAHQPYYRRYDRRLFLTVRSNQDRLVARFYQHNGSRLRSRVYRVRARMYDPDLVSTTRRAVGHLLSLRSLVRTVRHALVRALHPLLPTLRRRGITGLARRAGMSRLLTRTGVSRAVYAEARARAEEASLSPVRSQSEEIERLEAAVRHDPGVAAWLQLEEVYRRQGLLHSAEATLRRGLERRPDDPELTVRLIELLPLRRRWSACIELWKQRDGAIEHRLQGLTYARVARSYRELGAFVDALAVAEAGVHHWPGEPHVWDELYASRARTVNWQRASVVTGGGDGEHVGTVTDLGFLAGGPEPVAGELAVARDDAARVSLVVNGQAVATTYARPGSSTFTLACHDVLAFLGDGDVITVESAGRPLSIVGKGVRCEINTGYESRFDELARRLANRHVFTKFGVLRQAYDPKRKKLILALFDQVSEILSERHGLDAMPFYGNLLGAVREHDFISHDIGGFDMGYISSHHDPEKVKAEFLDVCRSLLDRGYHLRLEPWSVYVRPTHNSRVFVDVNYAWFTEAGDLQFSFGWRYPPATDPDLVRYPRWSLIGSHLVRVPGNAEQVLEQIYGPSWVVPDQGFDLEADLKRDTAFLLTVDEMATLERLDPDRVQLRLSHSEDGDETL